MYILSAKEATNPHNAFLHFWLSSGIVPLALFLAFWIQAGWKSAHPMGREFDSFRLPYFLFTFVAVMFGDTAYMSPWALLALSVAAGSAGIYGKQRLVSIRVGNKIRVGIFPAQKSLEPGTVVSPRS